MRERLPDRRPAVTGEVVWSGHRIAVSAGFLADGRVGEVFASGARYGSDLQRLLDDACVVISLALQHGARPADLGRSLGRLPVPGSEEAHEPASVLGAVVDWLAEVVRVEA